MAKRKLIEVVCTLDDAGAGRQAGEWQELNQEALGRRAIPNGAQVWFPTAMEPELRDLADRESNCCQFLDIAVGHDDDRLRLTITSEAPEAAPIIEYLTGGSATVA